MKYLKTKKDSLEEAISKAINEKPDSSKDLKEDVNAKDLLEKAGKYLKYSDLLLQKGRMMAKNKSTAMIDREIEKEKKRLGIKDEFDAQLQGMAEAVTEGDKEDYTKFFNAALKKFGVKSPADLKDDAKKKEFFNYVDKNYKGDHEESNNLEEVNAKYITDKDQGNRDLQKLIKKHKLKIKTLQKNVNPGYDEVEISGDKRDLEKMMKTTGDDDMYKFNPRTKEFELDESQRKEELDKEDKPTVQKVVKMLKKASKAHADQSKSLEKDLQDDVDKTIDTIQQANDSKRQSMRSILADIWKMNEGKSPFEKDEGFASDAQRRAAFASGYKAKGKKGKKEEIEKSDKTMTGKKPTKVEIEPQVK